MPRGHYKRTKKAKQSEALEDARPIGDLRDMNFSEPFTRLPEANAWIKDQAKVIDDQGKRIAELKQQLACVTEDCSRAERVIDALLDR